MQKARQQHGELHYGFFNRFHVQIAFVPYTICSWVLRMRWFVGASMTRLALQTPSRSLCLRTPSPRRAFGAADRPVHAGLDLDYSAAIAVPTVIGPLFRR